MTVRPHFFPQSSHAPTAEKGDHWQTQGLCIEDPELFEYSPNTNRRQLSEARAMCRACPVTDDCLEWAQRTKEPGGIWAGLTPRERQALRGDVPLRICSLCGQSLTGNNTRYCGLTCRRQGDAAAQRRYSQRNRKDTA